MRGFGDELSSHPAWGQDTARPTDPTPFSNGPKSERPKPHRRKFVNIILKYGYGFTRVIITTYSIQAGCYVVIDTVFTLQNARNPSVANSRP